MAPPGPNKWIGVREELCQVVLLPIHFSEEAKKSPVRAKAAIA
jgi:hypothetical protein